MGLLDRELDIYALKQDFERANSAVATARAGADLNFLRAARRAFFPLPLVDRRDERPADVLPRYEPRPARALEGKRVAVVAGGGAGACVAMVGAKRAFEEAGIVPDLIVSCSGGTIWGSMWAAGMSADEMARFSLTWHPEDYLDMQWARFPRFLVSGLKGFSGVMKGAAIERLFTDEFGELAAGMFEIPLAPIVYDMDRGRVEYFGTQTTPGLPIGRLVRIAIALPLMIEAVDVGGHLYVDGGIIDLMPMQPVIDDGDFDHVFALNHMLPPQLEPPDITGWADVPFGVLEASRQLQQGYHLEFARRSRELLGDKLTIVDAADHRLCRGVAFYEYFVDRAHWPELIREGYYRTSEALDSFREPERSASREAESREPESGDGAADGYAIAGASGSRASAASMSASENSGSSKVPAR